MKRPFLAGLILLGTLLAAGTVRAQEVPIAKVDRDGPVSFTEDVLPILQKNCLACHNASEANGDLVLESPKDMLAGGDNGPAIIAGKGIESLLLTLAAGQDDPVMPPPDNDVGAKRLTSAELGLLKLWIDQGAKGSAPSGVISPAAWRPLPAGDHPIYTLALSPDGQFAACGRANQIFIYHVESGQLVTRLNDPALAKLTKDDRPGIAHVDVVQSLAFSKHGDLLASGGFRTAKLWRYPRDVQFTSFAAKAAVRAVAVSPDRNLIALADAEHVIRLLPAPDFVDEQAEKPSDTIFLAGHTAEIRSMRFTHDGKQLISASADKTVRVWSASDGKLVGRIDAPAELNAVTTWTELQQTTPSPEGEAAAEDVPVEYLATGDAGNSIRIWNLPALPQPVDGAPEGTTILATSRDGSLLAMASAAGVVRVVRSATNELVHTWKAGENEIQALAIHHAPAEVAEEVDPESAPPQPNIQLAAASADGIVRVFDGANGEARLALHGSLAAATSIDFNIDGTKLAAGYSDGALTIWNLGADSFQPLADAGTPITVSATSPDRKLLATDGSSGGRPAVLVRELESGKLLHTLLGHEGPIAAIAFSPDGKQIASGSADTTARVWNLGDAKFPEVARFTGHTDAVTAVAFHGDAAQVLSGSADASLKLWNVADNQEAVNFAGHKGPVVCVAMVGSQAISAAADKTVRFWNAANGQAARTLTESSAVAALAISPDGSKLAFGLADQTVKVLQVSDGKTLQTIATEGEVVSVAFSPDNSRLVSNNAHRAMVWDVADGRLLEIVPQEELATSAFSPLGDTVVLCDAKGSIRVAPMRFIGALRGMSEPISAVAFHPGGQLILAGCADGTLRGFNAETFQQTFSANHGAAVHAVSVRADGQLIASAGADKSIKLWNAANGQAAQPAQLTGFAGEVRCVSFSRDGTRVAGGGSAEAEGTLTGELLVFDVAVGAGLLQQRIVGHTGETTSCLPVGGGNKFISASADGTVLSWQPNALRHIAGHTQPVTSLAIKPSAQADQLPELVSGSLDGTVRRWNLSTGAQLAQLTHGGPVTSVAVRGDGQRLASASSNNTVKLWNGANNVQLAQMQGDIRAQGLVARLTQEKNEATAKVASAKTDVEAAEQDLPVKDAAEKAAATALAAADKAVADKATALAAVSTTKSQAEKVAIDAAAAAKGAAAAMETAQAAAATMKATAARLAQDAERARVAAAASADDAQLAKALADITAAASAAEANAQKAEAATAAPAKAAADTSQAAADAAQKAIAMGTPFATAATELDQAQSAQRIAKGAHDAAARDLQNATDAVPASKNALAAVEALVADLDAQLKAATEALTASQLPVHTVAFSPDGTALASGGELAAVQTWDSETGKPMSSYQGHAGPVHQLAYLSDGALVSASADTNAIVWNLRPNWKLERVIGDIADPSVLADRVAAVDISPDGKLLATGGGVPSRSGELKVWNIADGAMLHSLDDAHTDAISAVAFSPDGQKIATAGADKFVKTFDTQTGEQLLQLEGHTNYATGVAWRGGGKQLASSGSDATIRTWNAESGDRVRTIAGFNKQVSAVRYIGATQFLVSSAGDPLVRMHNADNGAVQVNFPGPEQYMYSIDAIGDRTTGIIAAGGHDGVLRLYRPNGQSLRNIGPPQPEAAAPADQQVRAD